MLVYGSERCWERKLAHFVGCGIGDLLVVGIAVLIRTSKYAGFTLDSILKYIAVLLLQANISPAR